MLSHFEPYPVPNIICSKCGGIVEYTVLFKNQEGMNKINLVY